jgi:hypothetical protein
MCLSVTEAEVAVLRALYGAPGFAISIRVAADNDRDERYPVLLREVFCFMAHFVLYYLVPYRIPANGTTRRDGGSRMMSLCDYLPVRHL